MSILINQDNPLIESPCKNGCLSGFGVQCTNLYGRLHPNARRCYKAHVENDKYVIKQINEESLRLAEMIHAIREAGGNPEQVIRRNTATAAAAPPVGLRISLAQYQEAREAAHACDYRGPKTSVGCNCLHICFKGSAGNGRKSLTGDYWEATLQECIECMIQKEKPADPVQ